MPWLVMHFLLPAILLGALLLDEIVTGARAWYRDNQRRVMGFTAHQFGAGVITLLVIICGAWFLEASRLTYGTYSPSGARELTSAALDQWWLLALIPIIGLAIIVATYILAGARHTANIVLVAMLLVMSVYQVHAGFRLAFLEGDIAKDTLIYNTTAPDLKVMDDELTELSWLVYGNDSLEIGYNKCVAWPLTWYFRDNPGAFQISEQTLFDQSSLPPVIIANSDSGRGCTVDAEIDGYTAQTYVLRWHEPEYSIYRRFAIAPELTPGSSAWLTEGEAHGVTAIAESIWSSIMTQADPEGQQRIFRLVFFRELPDGLNPYRYTLYIRNDLLPYYNEIRYGE
jgi:hypothetical protein